MCWNDIIDADKVYWIYYENIFQHDLQNSIHLKEQCNKIICLFNKSGKTCFQIFQWNEADDSDLILKRKEVIHAQRFKFYGSINTLALGQNS